MKEIAVFTHGCKTNQYETEAILSQFLRNDYKLVGLKENPDIVIVNTCCVTIKAEAKTRHTIRKVLRETNPSYLIIAGCYVERNPQFLKSNASKFYLFENREKPFIYQFVTTGRRNIDYPKNQYPEQFLYDSKLRTRVPLKIQDGCDFCCAYCILPHVRGKPVSRHPEEILREVKNLTKRNVKEIILTGINLGLYGKDLPDHRLPDIVYAVAEKTDIESIRLSSLEPMFFDDDFYSKIQLNKKVAPHFHIALQSGSDDVLELMERTYTTEEAKQVINRIKSVQADAAIGCDVIVGFPGETDENFTATYDFVKSLGITYLHVFRYSERPYTKAKDYPNKVSEIKKRKRMQSLIKLGEKKKRSYVNYLLENKIILSAVLETKEDGFWNSLSDHYIRVKIPDDGFKSGEMKKIIPIKYSQKDEVLETRVITDD